MTDTMQERALAATNGSQLGAILRCAFNKNGLNETPRFTGRASITSDGFVMCNFVDRYGHDHMGAFVGDTKDLNDNITGLVKHLKLNDDEIEELHNAVYVKWIGTDWRGAGCRDCG